MAIISYLTESGEEWIVRPDTPLPVEVLNRSGIPLTTKQTTSETLLVVTTTVTDTTNRDLRGSTDIETRTLTGCGQYRKLVWFYFRTESAATSYRVLARVIDENGMPLATGWQQLVSGTLPGGANTWGRIDIPIDIEGFYDQYRIEVWRTSGENYTLRSKLIGVR